MNLVQLKPRKSLNKAFLKVKPNRNNIETFKSNFIKLIDKIDEDESEEFHKTLISTFLRDTYYGDTHFINTKGRNDLVIHSGKDAKSSVAVIVETKQPTNKTEMLSVNNINTKAFQELVLYYLRERITGKNLEVKFLIASNIYEWFIFDAAFFEKYFGQNKHLVKQFTDFEEGRLSGKNTEFFYKEIASPAIAEITTEFPFTHFDLRNYEKPIRNSDKADDTSLVALYKLLSPEHLLKLPFVNDSNSLDKSFYSELLHIIGLTEINEGSKKLIQRKAEGERNSGSLIESAIQQLDNLDKLSRIDRPEQYGENTQERLFNVALELVITWINRILFLKLLEAQQINYHKGDISYAFLSKEKIRNFDDLNNLFFSVLAKKQNERNGNVKKLFSNVPYLNSSLFEPTDLEHACLFISQIKDEVLPVLSSTVLKDTIGKRKTGKLDTLEYLFAFLDAYDFSSEGAEAIQEDNKTLINASVLGLIFEKINGYKDGSFFTPGFITMYMCRETIRRAIVQKFNDTKGWKCKDVTELFDKIDDKKEANSIINSLKICDPAVGSGHFLVSALNEIIAIKSELKVLLDKQRKTLRDYSVEIVNDELTITDDDGHLFEYNPKSKESQRIQESLFCEKQTIIENCLFGVDINPNSVKICRLRLWIELLKSSYYKEESNFTELETLPNIDINIKCGNSLISRYALDADIKTALKKSKWSIDSYRCAVMTYRNANSKDVKREMEKLINEIKNDFETKIVAGGKQMETLAKLRGELHNLTGQINLFGMSTKQKQEWEKKVDKASQALLKQEKEIEEIKSNVIYSNAFEWRFEFPEVLNDDGEFVGFDVVIGNPPYIRQERFSSLKPHLQANYATYAGTADIYVYFVEKGMNLLKKRGLFCYILPNKWLRAGYGNALRNWIKPFDILTLIDFGDLPVFEEATTYPAIWLIHKSQSTTSSFVSAQLTTLPILKGIDDSVKADGFPVLKSYLTNSGWILTNNTTQKLLEKIKNTGIPLRKYVDGNIYYGIKTGLNEAFVIDSQTREQLISEDPNSEEIIKPFLAGRDIKRYLTILNDKYLIFTRRGIEIERYPAILKYLRQFREKLEPKPHDWKGKEWPGRKSGNYHWYEIQDAVDYFSEFEKPKIFIPSIIKKASYTIDTHGYYGNDKTSIISSTDKHLLGLINSSTVDFFMQSIAATKQGGFFEYKPVYVSQLPIAEKKHPEIIANVNKVLDLKKDNSISDTSPLEMEIDSLVYELYGLTKDEIKIIENETK